MNDLTMLCTGIIAIVAYVVGRFDGRAAQIRENSPTCPHGQKWELCPHCCR